MRHADARFGLAKRSIASSHESRNVDCEPYCAIGCVSPKTQHSKVSIVNLSSGKSMIANGPNALHSYVAKKFEAAIGRRMPQIEVRYHNLSVTANVTVTGEITSKFELPTLFNTIKRSLVKFEWNKRVVQKEIIKGANGVFKPSTITLLLGQPGSGKTSPMRVLAGQFPKSGTVKIKGEVTYNGVPREEIRRVLPQFSAYATQFDKHFPTFTVQETLEFAHAVCGGGMSKHKEEC